MLRFVFDRLLEDHNHLWIRLLGICIILLFGVFFILKGTAKIIEETTGVLSHRTKLAGGMLQKKSNVVIFLHLLFSGVAIWLAAETMVNVVKVFSDITGLPFVVTGILAGVIGCMGEMIVIHNFTINPKGRLGDAIVGVAMDNIVTTIGASLVAVMGGIFLGGNALILIFVVILMLNTMLIWQISKLKNYFLIFRRVESQ